MIHLIIIMSVYKKQLLSKQLASRENIFVLVCSKEIHLKIISLSDKYPIRSIRLSDSLLSEFPASWHVTALRKKKGDLGKSFHTPSESVVVSACRWGHWTSSRDDRIKVRSNIGWTIPKSGQRSDALRLLLPVKKILRWMTSNFHDNYICPRSIDELHPTLLSANPL